MFEVVPVSNHSVGRSGNGSAQATQIRDASAHEPRSFEETIQSYLTSHSPLTDQQHRDLQALTSEAAKMWADGRHDDARRVAGLASLILRTAAPAAE